MAAGKDEKVHKTSSLKWAVALSMTTIILFVLLETGFLRHFWKITKLLTNNRELLHETEENTNNAEMHKEVGVLISEIFLGSDLLPPFVELYNTKSNPINLTGFSIKRLSASGIETILVTTKRFENITINPHGYLLITRSNTALAGDVSWPESYSFPRKNSALRLSSPSGRIDEVSWGTIPEKLSLVRIAWNQNNFTLTDQPTPQSKSPK